MGRRGEGKARERNRGRMVEESSVSTVRSTHPLPAPSGRQTVGEATLRGFFQLILRNRRSLGIICEINSVTYVVASARNYDV